MITLKNTPYLYCIKQERFYVLKKIRKFAWMYEQCLSITFLIDHNTQCSFITIILRRFCFKGRSCHYLQNYTIVDTTVMKSNSKIHPPTHTCHDIVWFLVLQNMMWIEICVKFCIKFLCWEKLQSMLSEYWDVSVFHEWKKKTKMEYVVKSKHKCAVSAKR